MSHFPFVYAGLRALKIFSDFLDTLKKRNILLVLDDFFKTFFIGDLG